MNMKRIFGLIIGLFALAVILWIGIPWAVNGGWPSSGVVGETLPPHIQYVSPADGEQVGGAYGICAHFNYFAGRGMGEEPETTIRFFLDGVNVTQDVVDLVRLQYGYPDPVGEPCYTRHEPLRSGWHTAKVTYEDISGERFAYKWRFVVITEE